MFAARYVTSDSSVNRHRDEGNGILKIPKKCNGDKGRLIELTDESARQPSTLSVILSNSTLMWTTPTGVNWARTTEESS